ncbi:hypothetical protein XA68_11539 [Ophiocordyceps unilateralis]|uniref:Exoribonuclease phosphorolytic domain-containing protein n=1 Tax=Ophiocordyceps unilateralis TaxID=268505 RepID=A0A2A9P1G6_OPHUN|nr:hypothetical protein XA68_11539 [Ophiocordyceps unilateralis]
MTERRRISGPNGPSSPPHYQDLNDIMSPASNGDMSPVPAIYLQTGVTAGVSGSAYLETEQNQGRRRSYVHSANVSEKDLSAQLEIALRGAMITERWPKSGVMVVVTVIESDQLPDHDILSGCVTVAAAALADAGIDCIDIASGGAGPLILEISTSLKVESTIVCQPRREACYVATLPCRDEIMALWSKGCLLQKDVCAFLPIVINGAKDVNRAARKAVTSSY